MLDPRIYRAGLVVAALGLIVLAFSLANQPGGSSSTLAPGAFNGQSAYTSMQALYKKYPARQPGSSAGNSHGNRLARGLANNFNQLRLTGRNQHLISLPAEARGVD